jgi:hypothetical protein
VVVGSAVVAMLDSNRGTRLLREKERERELCRVLGVFGRGPKPLLRRQMVVTVGQWVGKGVYLASNRIPREKHCGRSRNGAEQRQSRRVEMVTSVVEEAEVQGLVGGIRAEACSVDGQHT